MYRRESETLEFLAAPGSKQASTWKLDVALGPLPSVLRAAMMKASTMVASSTSTFMTVLRHIPTCLEVIRCSTVSDKAPEARADDKSFRCFRVARSARHGGVELDGISP